MTCFVKHCNNVKRLLPPKTISFFRFPKGERFDLWLTAIGRDNEDITWSKVIFVCSEHFKPEEIKTVKNRSLLVRNAVPSVNVCETKLDAPTNNKVVSVYLPEEPDRLQVKVNGGMARKRKQIKMDHSYCCEGFAAPEDEMDEDLSLSIKQEEQGFPTTPQNTHKRNSWMDIIKNKNDDSSASTRFPKICSENFVDCGPTYHQETPYVVSIVPEANQNLKCKVSRRIKRRKSSKRGQNLLKKREVACQVNFDNKKSTKTKIVCECATEEANQNVSNCASKRSLTFESIKNDSQLISLCGIDFKQLQALCSLIYFGLPKEVINIEKHKLLIFLMKLRTGIPDFALASQFHLCHHTISHIFSNVLEELVVRTKDFICWPSKDLKNIPVARKVMHPNCRVIIDCLEIKIEGADTRKVKYLIGTTPNGFIVFLSKGYDGNLSDSFLARDSGMMELLELGEVIISDKCYPGGVVFLTKDVEKTIRMVRCFKVLKEIRHEMLPYLDKILFMCCALTNLRAKDFVK